MNGQQQQQPGEFGGYFPGAIPQGAPFRNESINFVNAILKKDELEKILPEKFKLIFEVLVKNVALSNLSEKDVSSIQFSFDDIKNSYVMSKPPGFWTWEDDKIYTALRPLVFTEAKRAVGGMERKLLATSINQIQQDVNYRQPTGQYNGGFMGKVSRFLRR